MTNSFNKAKDKALEKQIEIIDRHFPKGKCKERVQALMVLAELFSLNTQFAQDIQKATERDLLAKVLEMVEDNKECKHFTENKHEEYCNGCNRALSDLKQKLQTLL